MTAEIVTALGRTKPPDDAWLARACPEPALEPGLSIIDLHMHFWDHSSGYGYFVEELATDVRNSGHSGEATIFVECQAMYGRTGPQHLRSVGETEFAVGQAAMAASGKYTNRQAAAGIIAFVDLSMGEKTIEALAAHRHAANGRF